MALRDRVTAVADSAIREDQVRITLSMKDGRRLEKFIEHAVGSVEHPMTDSDLEGKFTRLADGVLPADRIRRLMDLCWKVDTVEGRGRTGARRSHRLMQASAEGRGR